MSQLALPLAWPAAPRNDAFIVTPSNAGAARMLEGWGDWPVRTALLVGPRRSGRTLLARIFAGRSGGRIVDDADRADETALFHAWNRAEADGVPQLFVAEVAPPAWAVSLPDLRSRLAAGSVAAIGPPDDALVRALLVAQFERRGLPIASDLLDWLAVRLDRSHLTIERVVDLLDAEAMERRRRLSIPLARHALAQAGLIPGASPELPL